MRSFISSRGVGVGLALLALSVPVLGAEETQIAFSKRLGVAVLAEGSDASWCKPDVTLKVVSKKASFFSSSDFGGLMSLVGDKVFSKQCAAAERAIITGVIEGSNEQLLSGKAEKVNKWVFVGAPNKDAQTVVGTTSARSKVDQTGDSRKTLSADGKTVSYWVTSGSAFPAFAFEDKGYRNTYRLDCRQRRFLWRENLEISTGNATNSTAGAQWIPLNASSAIANAVFEVACAGGTRNSTDGVSVGGCTFNFYTGDIQVSLPSNSPLRTEVWKDQIAREVLVTGATAAAKDPACKRANSIRVLVVDGGSGERLAYGKFMRSLTASSDGKGFEEAGVAWARGEDYLNYAGAQRAALLKEQAYHRNVREPLLAFLRDLGEFQRIQPRQLIANPFVYEGKVVLVKAAFNRMLSRSEAVFGGDFGVSIPVVNVPPTRFADRGEDVLLAARIGGEKTLSLGVGGEQSLQWHLVYVDSYPSRSYKGDDLDWALSQLSSKLGSSTFNLDGKAYSSVIVKYSHVSVIDLATKTEYEEARDAGRQLFQTYCTQCHAADATGPTGYPDLTDSDWLWGGTPDLIEETIAHGRGDPTPGVYRMPAHKNILSAEAIDEVVEYVQSLSGRNVDRAKAEKGKSHFDTICRACHSEDGKGLEPLGAPNLTDNIWLYGASAAAIKDTIVNGRNGYMPPQEPLLGKDKVRILAGYVYSLSQK